MEMLGGGGLGGGGGGRPRRLSKASEWGYGAAWQKFALCIDLGKRNLKQHRRIYRGRAFIRALARGLVRLEKKGLVARTLVFLKSLEPD